MPHFILPADSVRLRVLEDEIAAGLKVVDVLEMHPDLVCTCLRKRDNNTPFAFKDFRLIDPHLDETRLLMHPWFRILSYKHKKALGVPATEKRNDDDSIFRIDL